MRANWSRSIALAASLSWGCVYVPNNGSVAAPPSWPPEEPRVSLVRIVATEEDLAGRRGFVDWLTGRIPVALFGRPYSLAWDGEDLLVADTELQTISRLGSGGTLVTSNPDLFDSLVGLAVCGGKIFASDSARGEILVVDSSLRTARPYLSGLERPTGLACLPGGDLAVAETRGQRILIVGMDGTTRHIGSHGDQPGEFNFPTLVAAAADGIWVGDVLNFRVQRFSLEGVVQMQFGELGDSPGQMPRTKGIAVDADGVLWISDEHLDEVALFDAGGHFLMSFGGPGETPGRFRFPAGIAIRPDGLVAVADSMNRRIQFFQKLPPKGAAR